MNTTTQRISCICTISQQFFFFFFFSIKVIYLCCTLPRNACICNCKYTSLTLKAPRPNRPVFSQRIFQRSGKVSFPYIRPKEHTCYFRNLDLRFIFKLLTPEFKYLNKKNRPKLSGDFIPIRFIVPASV